MAQIEGTSGSVMEVEDQRGLVNLPLAAELAGFATMGSENDPGDVTGERLILSPESSHDYRLRAELDTLLDFVLFNYAAQDTSKHIYRNTTMTNTWSGGFLNTNASGITTLSTGTLFSTYQHFPIFGAAETYFACMGGWTGTWGATNTTFDFGGFLPGATTHPYAPTDGVFFRANASGVFGVINYNGVEVASSPFTVDGSVLWVPTIGNVYGFNISVSRGKAEFWVDLGDGEGYKLMATINCPITQPQAFAGSTVPFSVRQVISGVAASVVQGFKLGGYVVSRGGYNDSRPWSHQMAAAGLMGYQGLAGGAQGSTANLTNSMAIGAGAAIANATAAAAFVGLGGQFTVTPTLAAGTDGILCSYLVPVPSSALAGRQLVITGVKIAGMVSSALTGGPLFLMYSLAFGHNAVSLATAEAATTKAPRRIALGFSQIAATAALGVQMADVSMQFQSPVVVNPGEYVAIAMKNIGTVTSAGTVTFLVTFDAHWA